MQKNELLDANQVAEMLGIKTKTLAEWRRLNKGIPYIKIGGRVRYDREVVNQFIKNSEVKI